MPSPITDLRRPFFHVCGNCPKLQEHRLPKIAVSAPWSVHFVQELNKRAYWTKTRGLLFKWIQPLEQAQQLCNASFWGQISWFRTAIFLCWCLMLEEGWISPFASRRAMNPVNAGVSLHSLCAPCTVHSAQCTVHSARGPAHTLGGAPCYIRGRSIVLSLGAFPCACSANAFQCSAYLFQTLCNAIQSPFREPLGNPSTSSTSHESLSCH